ncbi:hypothetical protein [Elioraea sp.]
MMHWPSRVIAGLKRLGFWRVMALLVVLILLWLTFRGPADPSLIHLLRRY